MALQRHVAHKHQGAGGSLVLVCVARDHQPCGQQHPEPAFGCWVPTAGPLCDPPQEEKLSWFPRRFQHATGDLITLIRTVEGIDSELDLHFANFKCHFLFLMLLHIKVIRLLAKSLAIPGNSSLPRMKHL